MKLWSGRFDKNTDALTDELNASIGFDFRMYKQDIAGSLAHSAMLAKQGIISQKDADDIAAGLKDILADIEAGKLTFGNDVEDVHMAVEGELTRRIGQAGKRLHTGRSRNDQVAVDVRLYLKSEIAEIRDMVLALIEELVSIAEENRENFTFAH